MSEQGKQRRAAFPHCDSNVLHAPKICQFCDMYPDWQDDRIARKIAFTGQGDILDGWTPCPSETARDLDTIERWPGNRAYPE